MKLSELIKNSGLNIPASLLHSIEARDVEIKNITDDSRKVTPGCLFVGIKGLEHDGNDYLPKAIASGAPAVVCEDTSKLQIEDLKIPIIKVENGRRALALLWSAWYGFPSEKLKIVGITGTDGKTTTTNLLYHILKSSGRKVGMASTINARFGDKDVDTGFHVTSPEPGLLQKLLSEMVNAGLEYVCLEVTSHGIDQERIAGVNFFGAVITNVTHEHLDYHKTYQNYLETKGKLFSNLEFSVLNKDDESYKFLRSVSSGKILSYSLKEPTDVSADKVEITGDGSKFQINTTPGGIINSTSTLYSIKVNLKLPGLYNVSNALAASASALELGLNLSEIKRGLESFGGLEGRFEEIRAGQSFRVIVDFAHTPNALESVLTITSKMKQGTGRLVCVFGCAGERDRGKREMMGEISGRLANLTVITAEDPRRENLDDIIEKISSGCSKSGAHEVLNYEDVESDRHSFVRVSDRREAIEFALGTAKEGDIIIVTGKGHEKSMCFGTTEYPWSDQEAVKETLAKLGYEKL